MVGGGPTPVPVVGVPTAGGQTTENVHQGDVVGEENTYHGGVTKPDNSLPQYSNGGGPPPYGGPAGGGGDFQYHGGVTKPDNSMNQNNIPTTTGRPVQETEMQALPAPITGVPPMYAHNSPRGPGGPQSAPQDGPRLGGQPVGPQHFDIGEENSSNESEMVAEPGPR